MLIIYKYTLWFLRSTEKANPAIIMLKPNLKYNVNDCAQAI